MTIRCRGIASTQARIAAAAVLLVSMSAARAECGCPATVPEDVINRADRIFLGRITEAYESGDVINYSVVIDDTLRGKVPDKIDLQTPVLRHCGAPVGLNGYAFYFLPNASNVVDRCSNTNAAFQKENHYLRQAIRLAHYPGGDARTFIGRIVHAFHAAQDADRIAEFLDLVSKLRPHGTNARRTPEGFVYRDIEVIIENGQFKEARPYAP